MGRGPGNSETEYVLIEMSKLSSTRYNLPYYKIIKKYFEPLKEKYNGTQLFYYLAGKYGIQFHLFKKSNIKMDDVEILEAIKQLKMDGKRR